MNAPTKPKTALEDWLALHDVNVSEMARRTGLTRQTLYNLMAWHQPTFASAQAIARATAGDVPLTAWMRPPPQTMQAAPTGSGGCDV